MTVELQQRYRDKVSPFDGLTAKSELLPLETLRSELATVAQRLLAADPKADLIWFKDWHFHDSVPSLGQPFDWSRFGQMLASDAAAEKFCIGDDLCAFAICPADFSWMFRIEVPETYDDPCSAQGGRCGKFDLTVCPELASLIKDLGRLEVVDAKSFFDEGHVW